MAEFLDLHPETVKQVAQQNSLQSSARMTVESVAAARFALPSSILHWLMVPMVVGELRIVVTMVDSLSYYPLLLAIHRPPSSAC